MASNGGITVRVAGLAELGKNLTQFTEEVKKKVIRRAARTAANEIRDAAKGIVVAKGLVRTGRMKEAIAARRLPKASSVEGVEVFAVGVFKLKTDPKTGKAFRYTNNKKNRRQGRVGKKFEVDAPEFYWKFLEFGTVKMAPKPFLVPAFELKKNGSVEVMRKMIQKGIDSATRKLTKPPKKSKT